VVRALRTRDNTCGKRPSRSLNRLSVSVDLCKSPHAVSAPYCSAMVHSLCAAMNSNYPPTKRYVNMNLFVNKSGHKNVYIRHSRIRKHNKCAKLFMCLLQHYAMKIYERVKSIYVFLTLALHWGEDSTAHSDRFTHDETLHRNPHEHRATQNVGETEVCHRRESNQHYLSTGPQSSHWQLSQMMMMMMIIIIIIIIIKKSYRLN
jgi:hypothetical protein